MTLAQTNETLLVDKMMLAQTNETLLVDKMMLARTNETLLVDKMMLARTNETLLVDKMMLARTTETLLVDEMMLAQTNEMLLVDKMMLPQTKKTLLPVQEAGARATTTTSPSRVAAVPSPDASDTSPCWVTRSAMGSATRSCGPRGSTRKIRRFGRVRRARRRLFRVPCHRSVGGRTDGTGGASSPCDGLAGAHCVFVREGRGIARAHRAPAMKVGKWSTRWLCMRRWRSSRRAVPECRRAPWPSRGRHRGTRRTASDFRVLRVASRGPARVIRLRSTGAREPAGATRRVTG
jgi:hypothetical protein